MLRNFINRNFLRVPGTLNCHISNYIVPSYPYMVELKELIHAFPNDSMFEGFDTIGDLHLNPFKILDESTSIKSNFYTWIISLIFYYNEYSNYKYFNYEKCLSIDHYDLLWSHAVDNYYEHRNGV